MIPVVPATAPQVDTLIGTEQAKELADEPAGAGQPDARHGEDHEQ